MQSSEFSFNGIQSYDKGFMNIRMGSELAKRPIVGARKPNTSNYSNKGSHFIQSVEKEPIEFELLIAPTEDKKWTRELYDELVSWLVQDEFKEFYSGDDPHKMYYAICKDYLTWEGLNDYGSIPVSFTTNANHAWTIPERITLANSGTKFIDIANKSTFNTNFYPLITIKKTGSKGSIVVTNYTNNKFALELKDVSVNEIIIIDNEYRIIYAKNNPRNVYGESFNKNWFYLVKGNNHIEIKGDCEITFDLQFPTA